MAAAKKLKGPASRRSPAIRSRFIEDIRQRALRLEDHLLRAGLHAHARGRQGIQLEPQLRRHRPDVARRLHHPQRVPGQDQGRVRQQPEPDQPAARPFFTKAIKNCQRSWRKVVALAARKGIPAPAFSTALAFYDCYRSARLPANLLQAQRDYFGAHTYERIDQPRGQFFHTNWTGHGGTTASGTYTV